MTNCKCGKDIGRVVYRKDGTPYIDIEPPAQILGITNNIAEIKCECGRVRYIRLFNVFGNRIHK